MFGQDSGAGGCGLLALQSRLVNERSTCSLSSAGRASRTERSTLDSVKTRLELWTFIVQVRFFRQLFTCEGDGTSMLRLSCSRVCFGVCLNTCRSLLVPGTGSGEACRRDNEVAGEDVFSWSTSAASVAKTTRSHLNCRQGKPTGCKKAKGRFFTPTSAARFAA